MDAPHAHQSTAYAPSPEVKFTPLEMKSVDKDGTFEGYASIFNREDMGGDIVLPGAFRESIGRRGPSGIKLLYQHDACQPIGTWTSIEEDTRGLYVQGRLMREVIRAREVHALMRAGALDGLSIGFKTIRARKDRGRGVRRLEKVDLWEISIVTFPLLPEARVASTKARPFAGYTPTQRELERWLTRDAGLSRTEARALTRNGFSGLKAQRDAGRTPTIEADLARQIRHAARLLSDAIHA